MSSNNLRGMPIPLNATLIKLHLQDLTHLFDALDPSPVFSKDLSPRVVAHIVERAREASSRASLGLIIQVDHASALSSLQEQQAIKAIQAHFLHQSRQARHRLRLHLRRGLISLAIGLAALACALVGSTFLGEGTVASTVRESLEIGGWVAMWRPMEMFLYDWWPIVGDRIFYYRLSRMSIQIQYPTQASSFT